MIKQIDLDQLADKIEQKYLEVMRYKKNAYSYSTVELKSVALAQLDAIETVEKWAIKVNMLTYRKSSARVIRMRTLKEYKD